MFNPILSLLSLLWRLYSLAAYVLGFTNVELRRRMNEATTYTQWKGAARLLDNSRGFVQWRAPGSGDESLFNGQEMASRTERLRDDVERGDTAALLQHMQYDFHKAMCGMHNPPLYTTYPSGTKTAVREFVSTIVKACDAVRTDTTSVNRRLKYDIVTHILRAYGTSALMLNSNAALGAFQVGVVKALHDANILPKVLCGSGSGAVVAAFAGCDTNITRLFKLAEVDFSAFDKRGQRGSLKRKLNRFWSSGHLMDVSVLLQFVKDNIGEITFAEAAKRTGRILNIHVTKYHPESRRYGSWVLNYLTAPDVLVYTAAVASCATYGVYEQVDILQRMPDGTVAVCQPATLRWSSSYEGFNSKDLVHRIRSLFGVTNFIVAEASLSRLPFLTLESGGFLGNMLSFFTEEMWRALAAVSRLPWFESRLTGVLQQFTQCIEADVVLYPVQTPGDVLRLLRNPDQKLLDYCMWRGEQAVWPHIERLRALLQIERALADVVGSIDLAGTM